VASPPPKIHFPSPRAAPIEEEWQGRGIRFGALQSHGNVIQGMVCEIDGIPSNANGAEKIRIANLKKSVMF